MDNKDFRLLTAGMAMWLVMLLALAVISRYNSNHYKNVTSGCDKKTPVIAETKSLSDHNFCVLEIDGCEYIVVDEGLNAAMMSHKGNCKYCLMGKGVR